MVPEATPAGSGNPLPAGAMTAGRTARAGNWVGGIRLRIGRHLLDWIPPAVLAVAVGHELVYDRAGPWDWVLTQALVWPLVMRRWAPASVLTLTVALSAVCWLRNDLFTAYLAVLFALHAVAAHRSRLQAIVAATGVEIGAILTSIRFAPSGSINDGVILLTALVMTFVLLGTTQRAQRQYLSVLEDRAAQLSRELDQQALIVAAEERRRIAREMHDIVAHSVSIMIALSEGASVRARTRPDQAGETMRQVAATGREALTELRKVLSVLRGPAPEGRSPQPTLTSLQGLVEEVRAAGLPVELTITGDLSVWPEALRISLFRIVQEGLTNVLKHAQAPTRAGVGIVSSEAGIIVTVHDDGRPPEGSGPDPGAPGSGLIGIRERVALFGGTMTAAPGPANGWLLTCTLYPI